MVPVWSACVARVIARPREVVERGVAPMRLTSDKWQETGGGQQCGASDRQGRPPRKLGHTHETPPDSGGDDACTPRG